MAKGPKIVGMKPIKPLKIKNPFIAAKKPVALPALRNFNFERLLCDAIAKRVTVMLRYDDDLQAREFGPIAVYYGDSANQKVLVSGEQLSNPNDFRAKNGPHVFEVGKIRDLSIGPNTYNSDARVSLSDNRYRNGIICSI